MLQYRCLYFNICNFQTNHQPSLSRHHIKVHNIRHRHPYKIKKEEIKTKEKESDNMSATKKTPKKRNSDRTLPADVVDDLIEHSTALFYDGEDVLSNNKHKKIAKKLKNMVEDVKKEVKPPAVFDER